MKILAATLLCDRKSEQQDWGPPEHVKVVGIDHYYVSVETHEPGWRQEGFWSSIRDLKARIPITIEYWRRSGWADSKPRFDQDQRRLLSIVPARNMAIDYALWEGYDWLLFLDADVVPEPDGLQRLLGMDKKLCGGLVPGRGDHANARYVFGIESQKGPIIKCAHGTCGYMLIHRDIFSVLRFRFGPHRLTGALLSEDPAYCSDARMMGLVDGFYVHTLAKARHLGELKAGEAAQF